MSNAPLTPEWQHVLVPDGLCKPLETKVFAFPLALALALEKCVELHAIAGQGQSQPVELQHIRRTYFRL